MNSKVHKLRDRVLALDAQEFCSKEFVDRALLHGQRRIHQLPTKVEKLMVGESDRSVRRLLQKLEDCPSGLGGKTTNSHLVFTDLLKVFGLEMRPVSFKSGMLSKDAADILAELKKS